jgi:hypothetical protein
VINRNQGAFGSPNRAGIVAAARSSSILRRMPGHRRHHPNPHHQRADPSGRRGRPADPAGRPGRAGLRAPPSGDLYVTVHVRPDKVFGRDGDDLTVTVPVSFTEVGPRYNAFGADVGGQGRGAGAQGAPPTAGSCGSAGAGCPSAAVATATCS